jgi:hypothetical protein
MAVILLPVNFLAVRSNIELLSIKSSIKLVLLIKLISALGNLIKLLT